MDLYLAGADTYEQSVILRLFGYPYRLISYFALREEKRVADLLSWAHDGSASWIMDSGLYSLMFGPGAGTVTTYDQARAYTEAYLVAMDKWGWKHPIVECDFQKLIGLQNTWKIRDEFFSRWPGEVVYVWHVPDGTIELKRLAREKPRIALAVSELRRVFPARGDVRKALVKLLSIARASGNPQVHLLGCTQANLLDLPANTADSTSWISGGTYGKVKLPGSSGEVSIYSPKYDAWIRYLRSHRRWRKPFEDLDAWVLAHRTAEQAPGTLWFMQAIAAGLVTYWMMMEKINAR